MAALKVWIRFEVKKKDGTVLKLRIQDMPSERFDEVVDFYIEYLSKNESMIKAAGVLKNPIALEECRGFTREMLQQDRVHIAVCCLDDDSPSVGEIIGISVMVVGLKEEPLNIDELVSKIQTDEYKKFFEIATFIHHKFDVMEKLGVQKTFDGRGIAVLPAYYGLGIATQFCKSRPLICKDQGVPVTWAFMTANGSQRAAEKAGWETAFQVPTATIEEHVGGCKFEGGPEFIKIMLDRVQD